MVSKMIKFNTQIQEDTMVNKIYGRQGSPWEFNLRDIFRWCEVMQNRQRQKIPELARTEYFWWKFVLIMFLGIAALVGIYLYYRFK